MRRIMWRERLTVREAQGSMRLRWLRLAGLSAVDIGGILGLALGVDLQGLGLLVRGLDLGCVCCFGLFE